MPSNRFSYEESCRQLVPDYITEIPPLLDRMPRYDDEVIGLNFFKTVLEDDTRFSGLTIPRTFIGRSEVSAVSFRNSDLSESCFCWNDFIDVSFCEADLSASDLRSSIFTNVDFTSARLTGADLRHSSFEDCSFEGADVSNAKLTRSQRGSLKLTREQSSAVDWHWRAGPQPDGG